LRGLVALGAHVWMRLDGAVGTGKIKVMDDPIGDADNVVAALDECRAAQRAQLLIRSRIEATEHGWDAARPSPAGWAVP
jgi:hypothetical protein